LCDTLTDTLAFGKMLKSYFKLLY